MSTSELIPAIPFVVFGVWLVLFPKSVIHFYTWFHKGRVEMPRPIVIRITGLVVVTLVIFLIWQGATR